MFGWCLSTAALHSCLTGPGMLGGVGGLQSHQPVLWEVFDAFISLSKMSLKR